MKNIIHEQINENTVAIEVKAAKITSRLLAQAMRAVLRKARTSIANNGRHGKQSLKTLAKQGSSLTNIEITGDNIGSFNRVARKYNVDFALKRDDSQSPPKWMVFFKAKDADALTAAFNEYSAITLKQKSKKPPLLDLLEKAKEMASQMAAPAKNRSRGGHEH